MVFICFENAQYFTVSAYACFKVAQQSWFELKLRALEKVKLQIERLAKLMLKNLSTKLFSTLTHSLQRRTKLRISEPQIYKHTWVVSECSIAFLDINVSISGNRLSTSVHYKPTDSHSYLLHSSSHPAHVKNSIPYSQFLRLRRLCMDDTDFSEKAEEMCQFLKTRGYPDPVIHNSKHRAQSVNPQSVPLSSHNKVEGRIPLTLTFHPHNISVKTIILKNFTSARSHHCRDFCATTPHFIQTGQKLKQFPS